MKLTVRYGSGRDYGNWNITNYLMRVDVLGSRSIRVRFHYPYQGERYQRPDEADGLWSHLPRVGSLELGTVQAMRWLAKTLTAAADAAESSDLDFRRESPRFGR
jgi:hypothetical protein